MFATAYFFISQGLEVR